MNLDTELISSNISLHYAKKKYKVYPNVCSKDRGNKAFRTVTHTKNLFYCILPL